MIKKKTFAQDNFPPVVSFRMCVWTSSNSFATHPRLFFRKDLYAMHFSLSSPVIFERFSHFFHSFKSSTTYIWWVCVSIASIWRVHFTSVFQHFYLLWYFIQFLREKNAQGAKTLNNNFKFFFSHKLILNYNKIKQLKIFHPTAQICLPIKYTMDSQLFNPT